MQNGGVGNFNVTPELIKKCENAHTQCQVRIAEMRRVENLNLEMKAAEKEKEKKKMDKIPQLGRDIVLQQNGLKMAENIIR